MGAAIKKRLSVRKLLPVSAQLAVVPPGQLSVAAVHKVVGLIPSTSLSETCTLSTRLREFSPGSFTVHWDTYNTNTGVVFVCEGESQWLFVSIAASP